jgi:hypothetical protein
LKARLLWGSDCRPHCASELRIHPSSRTRPMARRKNGITSSANQGAFEPHLVAWAGMRKRYAVRQAIAPGVHRGGQRRLAPARANAFGRSCRSAKPSATSACLPGVEDATAGRTLIEAASLRRYRSPGNRKRPGRSRYGVGRRSVRDRVPTNCATGLRTDRSMESRFGEGVGPALDDDHQLRGCRGAQYRPRTEGQMRFPHTADTHLLQQRFELASAAPIRGRYCGGLASHRDSGRDLVVLKLFIPIRYLDD